MRLQLGSRAEYLVAHALAPKAHDDVARPWAAVLVGATSQTMATLQVVDLQWRRHLQLRVDDLQHLSVGVLAVVALPYTFEPKIRPSGILFERVVRSDVTHNNGP